jgi:hypothetical protein
MIIGVLCEQEMGSYIWKQVEFMEQKCLHQAQGDAVIKIWILLAIVIVCITGGSEKPDRNEQSLGLSLVSQEASPLGSSEQAGGCLVPPLRRMSEILSSSLPPQVLGPHWPACPTHTMARDSGLGLQLLHLPPTLGSSGSVGTFQTPPKWPWSG